VYSWSQRIKYLFALELRDIQSQKIPTDFPRRVQRIIAIPQSLSDLEKIERCLSGVHISAALTERRQVLSVEDVLKRDFKYRGH
jgi:hypothetical protein